MRLIVKDMITISSIRPQVLRPGEVIEVSETEAMHLLARHPGVFAPDENRPAAAATEQKPRRGKKPAPPKEQEE